MPAVQYDYDYYEYGNRRRSSAKAGTSNGRPKTSSQAVRRTAQPQTSKGSVQAQPSRKSTQSQLTRNVPVRGNKASQRVEVKTATTRNVTRTSTRAVTRDTTSTTRKRTASKNLEIPTMVSKRQIQKPKEMSLKHAEVIASPKKKVATKEKSAPLKNVAIAFFAFSILFLICYRSSLINESFSKVNGMKSKLDNINTTNAQIESEIQTQTDLSNIESYAKYQLGMQKPKDSQIQKVVVGKEDKISTPVVIEKEEKTFLEKLINDIRNILD